MSFFKKIERTISVPRFDSYRQQGGDDCEALSKYLWNIALCESLYPVLHLVEVSYRNAVHSAICESPVGPNWLINESGALYSGELEKIKEAKEALAKRQKMQTEAYLVAELSFGFWNSLLDSRYELLWRKIIKDVFPNTPRSTRTRGDLSAVMSGIRNLRNSALHHHSIWHWADLKNKHASIYDVLGWICDSSTAAARAIDRFPSVYEAGAEGYASASKAISN